MGAARTPDDTGDRIEVAPGDGRVRDPAPGAPPDVPRGVPLGVPLDLPRGVPLDSSRGVPLDSIDRQILRELQADARITNVELARRVGISAPPCLRRMRRLEETGVVRGYAAEIEQAAVGWPITFFALVGLESQKEAALASFERTVAAWPEVRECHMIRGGGDFLLRVVARDNAHENRLTEALTGLALVARVQTLQTIRTAHRPAGLPL